ncbi:hypothetical protein BJ165DRAFT_1317844, partial [Panaeolus papilionaceus]
AGNYVQLAAVIVLVYDHCMNFQCKVERVWKQKLSGVSILFLLNRYGNLLAYIVIIDAYYANVTVCERKLSLLTLSSPNTTDRVTPSGHDSTSLRTIWPLDVYVGLLDGCILVGTHPLFSALWVAPLITDTCIFILTLYRIRPFARRRAVKIPAMMQMFIRDGVVYFFVIFTANIVNCLIYFIAPDELRTIGASFSQILTSVMISRLILNLRSL